jgi:hypothetical protein
MYYASKQNAIRNKIKQIVNIFPIGIRPNIDKCTQQAENNYQDELK